METAGIEPATLGCSEADMDAPHGAARAVAHKFLGTDCIISRMVVTWAWAETLMANTFACASNAHFNDVAPAFYRIPTFEARTKFLRALLEEWATTKFDRDAIDRVIEVLSRLSKTRNGWVHATWCRDADSGVTALVDMRSQNPVRPVKAQDVLIHVAAVRTQATRLAKLIPLPHEPAAS